MSLRKILCRAVVSAAMIGTPMAARAQAPSLCTPTGTTFGFFNGVLTSRADAEISLHYLRAAYGNIDPTGQEIKYEVFYNSTNGFEDFVEAFEQRLLEQEGQLSNRFEYFFEGLSGGGSWLDAVTTAIPRTPSLVASFVEYVNARDVAWLASLAGENPPTIANYGEHRARLDTLTLQGSKLLFFAHSQGNLFANSAYAYARSKVPANSVKLVHVAPASVALNGEYTLANLDLVIGGLRLAGSVPGNTTDIPGYLNRAAGVNGRRDILGHGLLEIYLNPTLSTRGRIDSHVQNALATLVAPEAEASRGFFTVTLTWNGTGDVDLHTFEPNGTHVFYASRSGASGFLDVDNVTANGPEHYFASCDPARLQVGTYRIGINNFARADGRVATVQLSSYRDGVLLTRVRGVGPARGTSGNATPISVMDVTVSRNAQTGQYSVAGN